MSIRDPKVNTPRSAGTATALFRVAIVGAGTLKGKELNEVIPDSSLPTDDVRLLDDDENLGQLDAVGDEITFVQPVARDNFDHIDFSFFTSDPKFTKRNWMLARDAGSAVIDLSYGLENEKSASLRAPWVSRELGEIPTPELQPGPVVVAHPAATVLALLLLRAQKMAPIVSAVATVFEPASELGKRGLDELHSQTVSILSFQDLAKEVFDEQVAFNMMPRYGEKAPVKLEESERRIIDHFKRLVGTKVPTPSLMLLQPPVFHGYGFSLHVEFESSVAIGDLAQSLAGDHIEVIRLGEDSASSVAAAGQDNILVSLHPDQQKPNGLWIWAAADNFRVTSLNAIGCAEQLAATRPRGQVQ